LISGLRIAGNTQSISALGETEVSGLVLNSAQNQLSIDFVGLGFGAGEALKYQYKLAAPTRSGARPPINARLITPAFTGRLSLHGAGGLTADGIISPTPATISSQFCGRFGNVGGSSRWSR